MTEIKFEKEYKSWLSKAQDDLKWAQCSFVDEVYYGVCLVAHQSAEKALKSFLVFNGENIAKIRIHNLISLLEKCKKFDQAFENLAENCAVLNPYYIQTRYPDIGELTVFNKEQAEEALQLARELVAFVNMKIEVVN